MQLDLPQNVIICYIIGLRYYHCEEFSWVWWAVGKTTAMALGL